MKPRRILAHFIFFPVYVLVAALVIILSPFWLFHWAYEELKSDYEYEGEK